MTPIGKIILLSVNMNGDIKNKCKVIINNFTIIYCNEKDVDRILIKYKKYINKTLDNYMTI